MSKRYPGNFITGNPVELSQTSNNGIWDVTDVSAAVAAGTWQEPDGIYEIGKSLRFRASANAYLNRTFGTPTDPKKLTFSFWMKRAALNSAGSYQCVFTGYGSYTAMIYMDYTASGTFELNVGDNSSTNNAFVSGPLFRDPSAWYHIVVVIDTNNSVAGNRALYWVNGVAGTWSTAPTISQGFTPGYTTAGAKGIGRNHNSGGFNFDGHLTEYYLIDGQTLDASYFGYFDPITNIWQPKRYTGSYGTNGFYLPFSENLSTTNLGRNFAGSNHFTYSQAGTDASYTYNNASGSANFTTAPDGTLTATKLTIDSSNTTHRFYKQYTVLTSGAVAVVSAYVKALPGSAYNVVALENWTGSAGGQAYFNLSTGQPQYSAAWPAGSGFQYVGDGWYRIWTTFNNATSNGSGSPSIGIYMADNSNGLTYTGNGTAGFYFWGVQANLGTTPDNYIATTSAASINNWTPNNISLTAGATYDSMVDSPTNVFTSATDVGGVVSGNYCTLNPVNKSTGGGTLSEANLRITTTGGNHTACGTIAFPSSGKWYFEAIDTVTGGNSAVGIFQQNQSLETNVISANINLKYNNMANNATFGFAIDMDNLTYTFYKSNVVASTGSASTGSLVAGVTYVPFCMTSGGGGASTTFNFGQRPFTYAPPAEFKSLNTTNLQALGTSGIGNAAIQANKWFDTVLYGGTGTARTITNPGGFVPDLVWAKVRNTTYSHNWSDSARGAGVRLSSDTTALEGANVNGGVTSFNTTNNNGYNIDGGVEVNENGRSYVSWQWKASPTSGLNIIPYTGTGVARSISHNLGVAPSMMIVKGRDGTADNWRVWHKNLTSAAYTLGLNQTIAQTDIAGAEPWNNTAPTSSVFTIGTDVSVNQNTKNFIAYLWAEVPGFSKFGSYTGNGSTNGPFVYTGFRPKWIMIKQITAAGYDWLVYDSVRDTYNGGGSNLRPNQTYVEGAETANKIDLVSNGFKIRGDSSGSINSANTHIYAAFAEAPFGLNNRAR